MLIQDAIFPDLKEVKTEEIVENQREILTEEIKNEEVPVEKVVRKATRKTTTTTKRRSTTVKRNK